jgi:hypothetical protein
LLGAGELLQIMFLLRAVSITPKENLAVKLAKEK